MTTRGKAIAAGVAKGLIWVVRFASYVLLLLLGRVLQPIAHLAIGVGILIFLFCLLVRPDMSLPMWAGAGLAVAGAIVSVLYEAALRLVAPADVVIVHEV